MKTVEEKAERYIKNGWGELNVGGWIARMKEAFIAGHAEAMRWRDPKEELPEEDTQVMIKGGILKPEIGSDFENLHCTGYYCDGVWYVSPTDYYSIEIENPTGWRPIK